MHIEKDKIRRSKNKIGLNEDNICSKKRKNNSCYIVNPLLLSSASKLASFFEASVIPCLLHRSIALVLQRECYDRTRHG